MKHARVFPAEFLEPLTTLRERVKAVSDLSEPDFFCELPALHDQLKFIALDLDAHPGGLSGEEISLQINGVDHLFTDWARMQLLDHLGTREKWFSRVMQHEQAKELTRRIHTFDRHRFRTMRTHEDINYVRGLVSQTYAEIPDIEVMDALCQIMPDGESLKKHSGKSDKAFYAFTMTREAPLGIGKDVTGFPGAIIKNSEVGATSLWVIPFFTMMYKDGFVMPVALRKHAMLRKVHRGRYADLRVSLTQALQDLSAVWKPLRERLDGLRVKTFATEQLALDRMEAILLSMKCTKRFVQKCTTTYGAAKNTAHNGLTVLRAVLDTCATEQLDSRYDDAEVAGYLLLHLL